MVSASANISGFPNSLSGCPPGSFWDAQSSQTLVLGTASSPVTKMVPVGGKLWCGSQNRVLVINTSTLVQEVNGKDRVGCTDTW